MAKFNKLDRSKIYADALEKWGVEVQATVAIEEMSEVIKEITKMLRGNLDKEHMAEEISDARIMLEQMCQILNINDNVDTWMDYKIAALKRKVESK